MEINKIANDDFIIGSDYKRHYIKPNIIKNMENYEKKYKEALKRAKDVYTYYCDDRENLSKIESIFPELVESEDERIRKALFDFFDEADKVDVNPMYEYGITTDKIISWLEKQRTSNEALEYLKKNHSPSEISDFQEAMNIAVAKAYDKGKRDAEKQGEQKPTDNVESKFHEGDWIVYKNDICQIVKREEGCNKLVTTFGIKKELVNERNLSTARLWTIQDAKDGDVLAFSNETIVIFKDLYNSSTFHSYCHIEDGEFGISEDNMPDWWDGKGFHPATKEQRNILFAKMHEAGYEWDVEKKEPRKIEHKPAWGEEDEHRFKDTIYFLDTAKKHYASTVELDACINWLKALKQRIGG